MSCSSTRFAAALWVRRTATLSTSVGGYGSRSSLQLLRRQQTTVFPGTTISGRSLQPHRFLSSGSTASTGDAAAAPGDAAAAPKEGFRARFFKYSQEKGPVSWKQFFVLAAVSVYLVTYHTIERERRAEERMKKVTSTGKPAIGGPWSLVDLEGNLVTEESFKGKYNLLYFGFARCPDICPNEMVKIGMVMEKLRQNHPEIYKKVVPIFVSIDPARDSLRELKTFSQDFHPDFVFLTGTPDQVQKMAKEYRVYVSKADETADGDYLVDHSIVVYFHYYNGELADAFTQSMKPTDIIEKMIEKINAPIPE